MLFVDGVFTMMFAFVGHTHIDTGCHPVVRRWDNVSTQTLSLTVSCFNVGAEEIHGAICGRVNGRL